MKSETIRIGNEPMERSLACNEDVDEADEADISRCRVVDEGDEEFK